MRISDETKRELVKIGAELSVKDGIERSMEGVVKYLIEAYKKENKKRWVIKILCWSILNSKKQRWDSKITCIIIFIKDV